MASQRLKLPMRGGAESLNAAAAATVMMYDYVRVWEEIV
jgi:tRNA G18 (ribose-2'-O)-methylase SpoU